MNEQKIDCPSKQFLHQFLLGHLSDTEIEHCQQHLSQCDPCLETVEGLKVGDTFTSLTRQALSDDVEESISTTQANGFDDHAIVNRMISKAEGWKVDSFGQLAMSGDPSMLDRAVEVQRLLQDSDDALAIGQLAHYRVLELLGTGSTGVVYRAIDTRLDRNVVLKILRPSLGETARARFVAEAKATATIEHPNVVTIYEVGSDGPLSYIAMQWIPGQTLENKLAEEETLSLELAQKLIGQLASGLEAAHEHGLIHRDIKPGNIWIPDNESDAKILDFGLVRVADEDPQLTCTGMIAGTPCYMSPEQSRGEHLDPRSDLFSLGCVLYQSLTGKLPFRADNALATLRSIQQDLPTAPVELDPTLPGEISDLTLCLLEKSPTRRPPNARAVVEALQTDQDKWRFEVHDAEKRTEPGGKRTAVSPWIWLAAMLAGISLGAIGLANGQQIFRIVTNQGEIEIETNVDDVEIEFLRDGEVIDIVDLSTRQSIQIKAGKYVIRPVGDQNAISIDKNQLTLMRGGKEIVRVTSKLNGNGLPLVGNTASYDPSKPYHLDSGDVLGLFIDGVLGQFNISPPIHFPPAGSGQQPAIGYPVPIDYDGTINLPLVDPIDVRGKTIIEARELIESAYKRGENPLLRNEARIIVNLMQMRSSLFEKGTTSLTAPTADDLAVTNAKIKMIELHTQLEVARQRFGPQHPNIKKLEAELREYRKLFNGNRKKTSDLSSTTKLPPVDFTQSDKPKESGPSVQPSTKVSQLPIANSNSANAGDLIGKSEIPFDNSLELPPTQGAVVPAIDIQFSKSEKRYRELQDAFDAGKVSEPELLQAHADFLEVTKQRGNRDINVSRKQVEVLDRLFKIFLEEEDKSAVVSDGSELKASVTNPNKQKVRKQLSEARLSLARHERDFALNETQPVYDGKNYEELLAIVQRERDLSKINPAIKGIANLADGWERNEMIESVMQVVRRGVGVASDDQVEEFKNTVGKILSGLDLETAVAVFERELVVGNNKSWYRFFGFIHSQPWKSFRHSLSVKFNSNPTLGKQLALGLVQRLNQFAKSERQLRDCFDLMVYVFKDRWTEWDLQNNPNAKDLFQRYLATYKDKTIEDYVLRQFAEQMPETKGFKPIAIESIKMASLNLRNKNIARENRDRAAKQAINLYTSFPTELRPHAAAVMLGNELLSNLKGRSMQFSKDFHYQRLSSLFSAWGFDHSMVLATIRNAILAGETVSIELQDASDIVLVLESDEVGRFEMDKKLNGQLAVAEKPDAEVLRQLQQKLEALEYNVEIRALDDTKKTIMLSGQKHDVYQARIFLKELLAKTGESENK